MRPTIILSSSDYSDSYDNDEKIPSKFDKNLNTTDSESDDDSCEKVIVKTFNPNKQPKKPIVPINRVRKPNINQKIYNLLIDDESSSYESDYSSYSYNENDKDHEVYTKTKIIKNNISFLKKDSIEEISIQDESETAKDKHDEDMDKTLENVNVNSETIQNVEKQTGGNGKEPIQENETIQENDTVHEIEAEQTNEIINEKDQININDSDQIEEDNGKQVSNTSNEILTKENHQIQIDNDDISANDINEVTIEKTSNNDLDDQSVTVNDQEQNQSSKTLDDQDEDDINPPIIKINCFQSKPSITYSIVRTIESSLRGKYYIFSFYLDTSQKFYTKVKVRNPEQQILIYQGPTVKFHKKNITYTLITDKEFKNFSLKKDEKSDEELLNLKVCLDALLALPRHVDIQFMNPSGIQILLTTKNPKMSTRGHWVLDFGDRFTIPSEKNMIFVSAKEKNGVDLVIVRQISNSEIELDLCTDMDEISVFAIGLSIFIAKLS